MGTRILPAFNFHAGRHWEGQFRDSRGRFCTKETFKVERTMTENKRLRLDCEKYKRMYMAIAKEYSMVIRENEQLKSLLQNKNGL